MPSANDAPVDLYIAVYPDPDAARGDWDTIKQLANDDVIKVDGLILVSRRSDGKIHVDDDFPRSVLSRCDIEAPAPWVGVTARVELHCVRRTEPQAPLN